MLKKISLSAASPALRAAPSPSPALALNGPHMLQRLDDAAPWLAIPFAAGFGLFIGLLC